MKSIIKQRREQGAVCDICRIPDYEYLGREEISQKHQFKCNQCGHYWCYGKTESKYTRLSTIAQQRKDKIMQDLRNKL